MKNLLQRNGFQVKQIFTGEDDDSIQRVILVGGQQCYFMRTAESKWGRIFAIIDNECLFDLPESFWSKISCKYNLYKVPNTNLTAVVLNLLKRSDVKQGFLERIIYISRKELSASHSLNEILDDYIELVKIQPGQDSVMLFDVFVARKIARLLSDAAQEAVEVTKGRYKSINYMTFILHNQRKGINLTITDKGIQKLSLVGGNICISEHPQKIQDILDLIEKKTTY